MYIYLKIKIQYRPTVTFGVFIYFLSHMYSYYCLSVLGIFLFKYLTVD